MVKDLQEFLAKVQADKALQDKMTGIIKASTQENVFDNCNAVAKEMGYTITQEDMKAFADEHKEELSDAELDKVAGGTVVVFTIGVVGSALGAVSLVGSAVASYKAADAAYSK